MCNTSKPKVVLFDLDDTLFDYCKTAECAHAALLETIRSSEPSSLALKSFAEWRSIESAIQHLRKEQASGGQFNEHDGLSQWKQAIAHVLQVTHTNANLLEPAFAAWQNKRVREPVFVSKALESVRLVKAAGYWIGSLSDGISDPKLIPCLAPLFDFTVTTIEAGVEKPDKRIFELALERAKCEARDVVLIGDRYDEDVLGAKSIGMKCIWVDSPLTYQKIAHGRNDTPSEPLQCDARFDNLVDAVDLVCSWTNEPILSACAEPAHKKTRKSEYEEALLKNLRPSCVHLIDWEQIGDARSMGFSGSSIKELRCIFARRCDVPPLLILKRTSKQLLMLASSASEKDKMKAERNDFSYESECNFLHQYASTIESCGCRMPKVFNTTAGAAECVVLMESFSMRLGWEQCAPIPPGSPTSAVLQWLARFHAAFLPPEKGGGGTPLNNSGIWSCGLQNMALDKRPAVELECLPQTLTAFAERFHDAHAYFCSEGAKSMGRRLRAVAKEVEHQLLPVDHKGMDGGQHRLFTMTHGDFMHSNIFVRACLDGGFEAATIDWQWAGVGVGAVDLFFLCAQSFSDNVVSDWESAIVRPYHDHLIAALGGCQDTYPYERVVQEFKLAALNFMRWISCARLVDLTPDAMQKAAEKVDINRGIVRRSMRRMVWLWQFVETCLQEAEDRSLFRET